MAIQEKMSYTLEMNTEVLQVKCFIMFVIYFKNLSMKKQMKQIWQNVNMLNKEDE